MERILPWSIGVTSIVVTVDLTFNANWFGAKNIYLLASETIVNSGSVTVGGWTVTGGAPTADSVSPASGTGTSPNFTFTVERFRFAVQHHRDVHADHVWRAHQRGQCLLSGLQPHHCHHWTLSTMPRHIEHQADRLVGNSVNIANARWATP